LKLGSDGYIKNVSRFFNVKWLPEIGVKTSKKSFHSLRHTFANEFKQAGVNEQVASELLGHASQSITYGRYGKESRVEILVTIQVSRRVV
jgi:integrase